MFLSQTLLSIANQTNKNFTLYIGDDCSPGNIYGIVKDFEDRIPLIYRRFPDNLGAKNLVSHWERCIDLAIDEEWIWLFSDDDIMDPSCVENFYSALKENSEFDLFHFNVTQIDQYQNVICDFYTFPKVLSTEEFFLEKLKGGYFSTVVEYIFRKAHFYEKGRFQVFDLAWGSDDATWLKLSRNKGIVTIDNSKVYWRKSTLNISAIKNDRTIVERKLNAQIEFVKWIYIESKQGNIVFEEPILRMRLEKWFTGTVQSKIEILPFGTIYELMNKLIYAFGKKGYPIRQIAFLYIYKIKRFVTGKIKAIISGNFFRLKKQISQTSF
jgi:glycosyltransferase involved in cell wall biosynthesis